MAYSSVTFMPLVLEYAKLYVSPSAFFTMCEYDSLTLKNCRCFATLQLAIMYLSCLIRFI